MADRPETLHEDTVSTAYDLLVNICTVFHMVNICTVLYMIPTIALFSTVRRILSGPGLIIVEASRSDTDTALGRSPLDE